MSLPSQVGRTPGKGPKVESRTTRPRPKPWLKPAAMAGGVVVVIAVVWASVTMIGGPAAQTGPRAATPADPLGGEASARTERAADPAMDAILGGGTPRPGLLDEAIAQAQRPAVPSESGVADSGAPAGDGPIGGASLPESDAVAESDILGEAGGDDGDPGPAVASADADLSLGGMHGRAAGRTEADASIDEADRLIGQGRLLAARDELNAALVRGDLPGNAQQRLRDRLSTLNDTLVFGKDVTPGDDIAAAYTVQPGDSLARIASREGRGTHWTLLSRINGIADPSKIRVGQRLKVVRGPFHAVVHKSDFRMDVFHGPAESPAEWVYVTSMPVGLGADDGTPLGTFAVSAGKLENPGWVNPRDRSERYDRDDPKNPIGEYWIGLTGVGESAAHEGYGIHGTIDPASIGRTMSMGCVRLGDADVALVYELLGEGQSVVHIVP